MYIARKDAIVYLIYASSDDFDLVIYEDQKLSAYKTYSDVCNIKWDCYIHFKIKDDDWKIVDYLPEPYRNWSSIDAVKASYGGESILFEETWDVVTENSQYIAVDRNEDGTWNIPGKKITDNEIKFITITESKR